MSTAGGMVHAKRGHESIGNLTDDGTYKYTYS